MLLDFANEIDVKRGENHLRKLIESKSKSEIKGISGKRTVKLNSYLHVCISLYSIHFGYTLNESKTDLKRLCSFMVYEKNGSKYLKETKKLNNDDCSKFVEWIRNFSSQNGCYIPDAEEYKTNKYTIDKEINNHKQYL
jgi:hypothetical protein